MAFRYMLFFVFLFLCGCTNSGPDFGRKYFEPIKDHEVADFLLTTDAKTCDEFLDIYFENREHGNLLMQALAYDIGLCIPQDLRSALYTYEELFVENRHEAEPFKARPAMIYMYGPDYLKNSDKALFYFRQSVIYMGLFKDITDIRRAFRNTLGNKEAFPPALEEELVWLQEIRKTPYEQRKPFIQMLDKQGFINIRHIWFGVDGKLMWYGPPRTPIPPPRTPDL